MPLLKKLLFIAFLLLVLQTTFAQQATRMFIFGHSLLDHRPPLIPTPSDETTVPHWMYLLSQHENQSYAATGQYGFLPQHENLPPFAQWGYDIVPPVWESDTEPFSDADFNKILITAGNFMQWQAPDQPYPNGGGTTPVSATENIMDWLVLQESNLDIYIYENWPDMAPYISGSFPPSSTDFDNYNAYTLGNFHDWWIDYQDLLLASRPGINVRMIPVGPILANLYGDTLLTQIPITELYEDDAPHGRATTYFLAGLITYMAINETKASNTYSVPSIVHSTVATNYSAVIDYIWNELNTFNDTNGNSRVFNNTAAPVTLVSFDVKQEEEQALLSWSTELEINNAGFDIEHSSDGIHFRKVGKVKGQGTQSGIFHYIFRHSDLKPGANYYRLKQIDFDGTFAYGPTRVLTISNTDLSFSVYPNPTSIDHIRVEVLTNNNQAIKIKAYDLTGRLIHQVDQLAHQGTNNYLLHLPPNTNGLILLEMEQGGRFFRQRLMIEEW